MKTPTNLANTALLRTLDLQLRAAMLPRMEEIETFSLEN